MVNFQHRRIDGPTVVTAGLSLLVFAYVATRAANLCITMDEAATYNDHVTGSWLDIILFRTDGLPDNNHVLHTLLCKISVMLSGLSELTLRIPSLFGCLFYLLGINICLRRIFSGWKIVIGFLAVGMNPYVLDYLGLARGYGLGLGFSMLGLAAMLSSFTQTAGKVNVLSAQAAIVLFGLATLSNLSYLLVLFAAMLLLGTFLAYSAIFDRRIPESSSSAWPILLLKIILPAVPFLAYLALPIGLIRKMKLFGEGGQDGFWSDTVAGLLQGTAYASPRLWQNIDSMIAWVVVSSLFVPLALVVLRRTDERRFFALFVFAGMTFSISLLSIAQHYMLNVAYLQGRRGIFLIPFFLLTVLAFAEPPRQSARWYVIAAMVFGLLVPSVLAVHDVASMNLRTINDWNNYEGTRPAMLAIRDAIGTQKPERPRKMLVNYDFQGSIAFYRSMLGMESILLPIRDERLDGSADYYYGHTSDAVTMARNGARPLLLHPASRTILYESAGEDLRR
jgi:hypothetical protein